MNTFADTLIIQFRNELFVVTMHDKIDSRDFSFRVLFAKQLCGTLSRLGPYVATLESTPDVSCCNFK